MKLKKFLAAAFAGVVLAAACTEEDPLALKANIEIDEEQLSFNEEADEKDITLTSTRNWKLNAYEEGVDWISVTPESGDASVKPQTVTISVKKNDSYNRETYLEFTNGTMSVPVLVKQIAAELSVHATLRNMQKVAEFVGRNIFFSVKVFKEGGNFETVFRLAFTCFNHFLYGADKDSFLSGCAKQNYSCGI